jgi:hypothetical protein
MAAFGAKGERMMNRDRESNRAGMRTIFVCAATIAAAALIAANALLASEAITPSPPGATAGASAGEMARPASWEYSPYRIVVYVEFGAAPEWPAARRAALLAEMESQARSVIGGLWRLKTLEAPAELHWDSAAEIARVATESLPPAALEADKVMLFGIGPAIEGRCKYYGREYDVRTETWGPPFDDLPPAGIKQIEAIVPALWGIFRPVLRIETSEQGVVTAIARGGGLPVASSTYSMIRDGAPYRPLIRHFDAAGRTIKNGVFPIDWTWLVVDKVDGATAKCLLKTGVQEPFDLKLDGRTEYLALAANVPRGRSTELIVQARGTQRPLEDLEIFAQQTGDKSPRLVGRTDSRGALRIEGGGNLETVFVRSGDDLLAQFPLAPGLEPSVVARVEDNGRRLESGNLVARLGEELIDLVVQQAVLEARFKRQWVHGNREAAEKTLAAVKSLKTSEAFLKSLEERRAALSGVASDPAAAAWLDKHLDEIKPLATKHLLDAKGVARLESILTDVRGP